MSEPAPLSTASSAGSSGAGGGAGAPSPLPLVPEPFLAPPPPGLLHILMSSDKCQVRPHPNTNTSQYYLVYQRKVSSTYISDRIIYPALLLTLPVTVLKFCSFCLGTDVECKAATVTRRSNTATAATQCVWSTFGTYMGTPAGMLNSQKLLKIM